MTIRYVKAWPIYNHTFAKSWMFEYRVGYCYLSASISPICSDKCKRLVIWNPSFFPWSLDFFLVLNFIKCLRFNVYQTFIVFGQKIFKLGIINDELRSLIFDSLMLGEGIKVEKRSPSIIVILIVIKVAFTIRLSLAWLSALIILRKHLIKILNAILILRVILDAGLILAPLIWRSVWDLIGTII